jgi:hypothetical protein
MKLLSQILNSTPFLHDNNPYDEMLQLEKYQILKEVNKLKRVIYSTCSLIASPTQPDQAVFGKLGR